MRDQICVGRVAEVMGLSRYQSEVLRSNMDKYTVSGMVKRGGVLYVPHRTRGFFDGIARLMLGRRADLVGRDKILLRAQRRITFCADGYHCVRIGRFMYYADASGQAVSREMFMNAAARKNH